MNTFSQKEFTLTATAKDNPKVAGVFTSTLSRTLSKNLGIPKETTDRLNKHLQIWDVFLAHRPEADMQSVLKYFEFCNRDVPL